MTRTFPSRRAALPFFFLVFWCCSCGKSGADNPDTGNPGAGTGGADYTLDRLVIRSEIPREGGLVHTSVYTIGSGVSENLVEITRHDTSYLLGSCNTISTVRYRYEFSSGRLTRHSAKSAVHSDCNGGIPDKVEHRYNYDITYTYSGNHQSPMQALLRTYIDSVTGGAQQQMLFQRDGQVGDIAPGYFVTYYGGYREGQSDPTGPWIFPWLGLSVTGDTALFVGNGVPWYRFLRNVPGNPSYNNDLHGTYHYFAYNPKGLLTGYTVDNMYDSGYYVGNTPHVVTRPGLSRRVRFQYDEGVLRALGPLHVSANRLFFPLLEFWNNTSVLQLYWESATLEPHQLLSTGYTDSILDLKGGAYTVLKADAMHSVLTKDGQGRPKTLIKKTTGYDQTDTYEFFYKQQ